MFEKVAMFNELKTKTGKEIRGYQIRGEDRKSSPWLCPVVNPLADVLESFQLGILDKLLLQSILTVNFFNFY